MRKFIAIVLSLVLALGLFAGCAKTEDHVITIGATATPHAEVLEVARQELAKEGWELKITVYNDYIIPNQVVEDGEMDANYFQHIPYLNDFNAQRKTHLVNVLSVHYEPYGIYAGTKQSLDALAEGDKIAIPNDSTNRARALLLLQAQGIIRLTDGIGLDATKLDIQENKLNLDIVEMEAAQIASVRDSVALVVLNGNYAMQAGLNVGKDAVAAEDAASVSAQTYANVLVVKDGNQESEKTQALIRALKSEAVRNYINETYEGAVVPLT